MPILELQSTQRYTFSHSLLSVSSLALSQPCPRKTIITSPFWMVSSPTAVVVRVSTSLHQHLSLENLVLHPPSHEPSPKCGRYRVRRREPSHGNGDPDMRFRAKCSARQKTGEKGELTELGAPMGPLGVRRILSLLGDRSRGIWPILSFHSSC